MLLFDFGGITNKTPEQLEAHLSDELTKMGKEQDITVKGPSLESQLKALMKALASKGHVVVLIDEYDQPLIDNLHNPEVAEGNRRLLRSFFRALKSLDEYIQFTFITGISTFSRVSIFSGANHLKDISMTTKYATMMGYTQEELVQYFSKHLQAITQKRNAQGQPSTEEAVLAEIKDWYNGYRFSEEANLCLQSFLYPQTSPTLQRPAGFLPVAHRPISIAHLALLLGKGFVIVCSVTSIKGA